MSFQSFHWWFISLRSNHVPQRSFVTYPLPRCLSSRSFQHGLDLNTGKDIHYAQVADPAEGLAYKSTRHSMFLYSDVQIDGDSTTTQENPFHSSDERGTHSSIYYSYDLHPELASSSSTRPGYPSSGSKHGYSEDSDGADPLYAKIVKPTSPQAMHEVNEIALAYDTAISPMDGASERTSSVSTINGSVPTFPTDHMGTFRGGLSGSTQRLVTPKGSVSRKGGVSSAHCLQIERSELWAKSNPMDSSVARTGCTWMNF